MVIIDDLIIKERPAQSTEWAKVFNQACGHTRRLDTDEALEKKRPSESKEILDYRIENRRMLTKEGVDRFLSKSGRILEGYGINFAGEISKELEAFLLAEQFYYLAQYSGLKEYTYRVILPSAIEDPNGWLMVWPENSEDPSLPAAKNPANKPVKITTFVIQSDQIYAANDNYILWRHGFIKIENKHYPVLRSSDKVNFYIHVPRQTEDKKKIVWDSELWYNHNYDYLPINILPGNLAKSNDGYEYNESFLHSYFEYGDEFKGQFSDDQAIRVQHAFPKVIMSEMPCMAEGCKSGKIHSINRKGEKVISDCQSCDGKGKLLDPGPYGILIRPKQLSETGDNPEPLSYVNPDTSVLKISYDTSFDLLERAKMSIGLDILTDLNESGVAKDARLEDLQDLLVNIAGSLFDTLEMFLYMIEGLLVPNPASRKPIKIKRPQNLKLKDQTALLNDYEKALPSDRFSSAMDFYENKYKGQEEIIRAHELAMTYAPLLLVPASEVPALMSAGIYGALDIRKRDRAERIFLTFAKRADFFRKSEEDLFAEADRLIGVINEPFSTTQ